MTNIHQGGDPWQTGNAEIADMNWRPTGRRKNAHPVRKNVNFWTTPATPRIANTTAKIQG